MAGRSFKISQMRSGMPNVLEVLDGWMVDFIVDLSTQEEIDGDYTYRSKLKKMKGVMQPLKTEDVNLKPEGQRAWEWYQLHIQANQDRIPIGKIVTFKGKRYKIMAMKDYSLNGYYEYHLVRDYERK